jgi:hypothetical protein
MRAHTHLDLQMQQDGLARARSRGLCSPARRGCSDGSPARQHSHHQRVGRVHLAQDLDELLTLHQ